MAKRNDEMTIEDILGLLWGYKWVLLFCAFLGTGGAVFYAQTEIPIYQVDGVLQLEGKSKGGGADALGAMSDLFQTSNPAETEIEVIRSRLVLGRAAEKLRLDLHVAPIGWGRIERLTRSVRPDLSLERLDVPRASWGRGFEIEMLGKGQYVLRDFKTKTELLRGVIGEGNDSSSNPHQIGVYISDAKALVGDKFLIKRNHPLVGIGFLRRGLSVAEVGKKTGIISLTFTGDNPERISEYLNEIANSYVRQDVEQKSAEAEKTLAFLQEQLPEIKRNLEAAEARLNQFRSQTGSVDLTEEARLALGQQVEVQQRLFEIQQKRKEALQLFREDHPNILILDTAISRLNGKIGSQDRQVRRLPLHQQEVVRLMRDVQVNTELYTGLLNNSQQLKVVKAGEIGNVRVIDYAVPFKTPIKPRKNIIILTGLLLGLGVGAAFALIRRVLQSGVDDPRVIEETLGLPVYSSIPHSATQSKLRRKIRRQESGTHLLALADPDDLAMESLRSLRTTLHFSMLDASNKILLLAGPSPSIGKSFVSSNFAATLAMAGHKVLLIDADLRRGKIHRQFGRERGDGLSDLLSGKVTANQALNKTDVPGLQFMSTGTLPPNPSELLLHENFSKVLEVLKPIYDYIVIDSAPVLAVTDAVILGKLAGTTLMVLKHGKHPIGEIEACQKRLAQADVPLKGVIFNDVMVMEHGSAARYGTGTYQYAYTSDKAKEK